MEDREKVIIDSLESLNKENREIKSKSSLKYKLKDIFKFKNIKKRFKKNIRTLKCKALNLKESQVKEEEFNYSDYNGNKKIIIYTCITGNYDNILEPYYIDPKCEYTIFTDLDVNPKIYVKKDIPDNIKTLNDRVLINRYIKMHPHELFENEYDYAIYIDGNIKPVSNLSAFVNNIKNNIGIAMHKHSVRECIYDEAKILKIYKKGNPKAIDNQILTYRRENFPKRYGMAEANVIVTDLKSNISKKICNEWWGEFINSKSMRDQLSLPYVLWKNNLKVEDLTTLGNNVNKNPKLRKIKHIEK